MAAVAMRSLSERALEVLRRAGNPFRNYFARNPDDEVCALYHVPDLFARERQQLLDVVDLYRTTPGMHCEVVPVLGNKGSGKTHLLHSIKHGTGGLAAPGHAGHLPARHRIPRIPALPGHRHPARRRQAAEPAAAGRGRQPARAAAADPGPGSLDAGPAARSLSTRRPRPLGAHASASAAAGPGTRPVADHNLDSPPTLTSPTEALRRLCEESGITRRAGLRPGLPAHRAQRGAQHGRPHAPLHPHGLRPGRPARATNPTWPASSPTASPSSTSRSGPAGKTWCWRCSRC